MLVNRPGLSHFAGLAVLHIKRSVWAPDEFLLVSDQYGGDRTLMQAACDANMMAYAQLEVMGMLPSLKVAKIRNPPKVDEADLKVRPSTHSVFSPIKSIELMFAIGKS